jgi:hypothetical protein
MIHIPSFIRTGAGIQKLMGGGEIHRQQGDIKSLLLFFQNKETSTIIVLYPCTHTRARIHKHTPWREVTLWNRVLLEKLTVTQLLKKLPTFYGTREFITVFTRNCHWTLSWATWILCIPSYSTSFKIHFNNILPFATKYPKHSLSVGFPNKILKYFSALPPFHKKRRHLPATLFDKELITDVSQQIILKVTAGNYDVGFKGQSHITGEQ